MTATEKVIAFPQAPRRTAKERAFLPAALEIQETPPSPVGRAVSLTIIVCFCVALALSYFGTLDIVASATGRIVPSGRTKIVQPVESGVIRKIWVNDGQMVHAGEVLIELDPAISEAERNHVKADWDAARLDVARLKAALDDADPLAVFSPPADADPALAATQRRFLVDLISEHNKKLATLDNQLRQKQAELATVDANLAKIHALLPILAERVKVRETLFNRELGSKLAYLETYQSLVETQSEVKVQESRRHEAEENVKALREARAQVDADWRRALLAELADSERKAAGLAQDVAKADQRARQQVLTAPVDGIVQQLSVHSVGGVVTPAQTLLAVVPAHDDIEIEALISNRDIGFVTAGQEVEIKIDTFTFTRYGLLHGQVISVSRDAVERNRASERQQSAQGAEANSSEPKSQDLVYPARIAIAARSMWLEDREAPLLPGMAVTAEIKTGARSLLSYLLSPLQRYRHEALRER